MVVGISLLIGFHIYVTPITILAIVFMAMIAATFIGLGLALSSIINDFQGFQLVTSFFTMPLFFLSDSLFPASSLPGFVQFVTYLNPLTYGVDGLRNTLLGSGIFSVWTDLLAMAISTAIMVGIATYAFSKTEAG